MCHPTALRIGFLNPPTAAFRSTGRPHDRISNAAFRGCETTRETPPAAPGNLFRRLQASVLTPAFVCGDWVGTKILLPLDILAVPGNYLPRTGEAVPPHNEYASDPVFEDEPARLFRNAELTAGRLPIWNPYQYAGVPNISVLSPFALLGALI